MSVSFEGCVSSDTGLRNRPIPPSEKSYQVCLCVTECDKVGE